MVMVWHLSKKGYMYTLEVLLALSLIFVAIVYLFSQPTDKPELEISIIKMQGFQALKYLDEKGVLRKYVSDDDEKGIEKELKDILIKNIKFETEICVTTCSTRNVPSGQAIISVTYYVSGYRNTYDAKKVRLYMWRT
jgi:hypothetical protein